MIGVGIPTRNRKEHLENCLLSLLSQTRQDYKLCIIDDNDNAYGIAENFSAVLDYIKAQTTAIVLHGARKGPPWAHNKALMFLAKSWGCKYIMRVDDDVTLDQNCLDILASFLDKHSNVGIAAPIVIWGEDNIDKTTDDYNTSRIQWMEHEDPRPKLVNHVGTTFMYRTSDALKIGGWAQKGYSPVAYREETDFCFRMRVKQNKKIVVLPDAKTIHHIARSGGIERDRSNYAEMEKADKKFFAIRMRDLLGINDPEALVNNNFLGFYE